LPTRHQKNTIAQGGIRHIHDASSATELAGMAVSMYEKEREKSERGPLAAYEQLLDNGTLRQDPRQQATVNELERVYVDLVAVYRESEKSQTSGLTLLEAHGKEARTGWWKSLFSSEADDKRKTEKDAVKGLYMYGGVGCGKTMLMDMFAESVPSSLKVCLEYFMLPPMPA
jgi:protein AFG1